MNTNPEPDSRSPSNEEKDSQPLPQKLVFLALRVVPRRLLGSRLEERFEAELRELIGDVYVTVGRVARTSRDLAKEAARALAYRRGWAVSDKRFSWATRNAAHEQAIAEDTIDEVPPERQLTHQSNTPCGNEDCDKCYPLPRFVVSADHVEEILMSEVKVPEALLTEQQLNDIKWFVSRVSRDMRGSISQSACNAIMALVLDYEAKAGADLHMAQSVVRAAMHTVAISHEGLAPVEGLRSALLKHDMTVGPLDTE